MVQRVVDGLGEPKERDGPKAVEGTFVVLQEDRIVTALVTALMFLGPLLLFGFFAKILPPGVLGLHVFVLAMVVRHYQRRHNYGANRIERGVRVTSEGVFVEGVLVVRKEQIADGHFQPRTREPNKKNAFRSSVRLLDNRKRILFEQEAWETQAVEILQVLGLDAGRKRAEFSALSPLALGTQRNTAFASAEWGAVMALVGLLFALGVRLAPALFFLLFPLIVLSMWPSRIAVGVDGILVRWLWRERFIPMSQIVSVAGSGDREITIRLASGKIETLHLAPRDPRQRRLAPWVRQKRDAMLARIHEALEAHRSGASAADVAALVGRGSRSRSEWIEAIGKLREGSGYRTAVVRDEDLWSVVEDPAAPEDARAGAAIALRTSLDEAGKERVRVAAEATASPKLRIALDAAAGDSDEVARSALHELVEDTEDVSQCKGDNQRAVG